MRSDRDPINASSPPSQSTPSTSQQQASADSGELISNGTSASSNSEQAASSAPRRPAPSPANSPEPKPSPRFPSVADSKKASAYKRARTVSPIIDENSSDVENDNRSHYSRSASDLGETDPAEPPSSHPTPLRQSISSADVSRLARHIMSAPDQNVEGLLTEQSLSLDDGATVSSSGQATSAVGVEQPPSYQETIQPTSAAESSASNEPRPTGQQQLDLIRPMKNRPLQVGDQWYLISRAWWQRWHSACSANRDSDPCENAEQPIGPIDNSSLLSEYSTQGFQQLVPLVSEGIDYEMLPQEGWNLLVKWYGSKGPLFEREVIPGLSPGQESVEFYPPSIRLLRLSEDVSAQAFNVPSLVLSVSSELSQLKARAKTAFDLGPIPDFDVVLHHFPAPTAQELQSGRVALSRVEEEGVDCISAGEDKPDTYRPDVTLKSVGVDEVEVTLLVETRHSGRWQSDPAPPSAPVDTSAPSVKGIFAQQQGDFFSNLQQTNNAASTSASEAQGRVTRSQTANDRTMGRSRGLRGLNNLGNTCFMNSALQCLSNTYELQQYFVSGAYKEELNTDNPLGMGGAIAEAFGNLIANLWNGQGGSFWPREFKYALSRFAPQFSGYAQHDSQELLAFLLDGLHEDLNRILKKPYIEAPDWEGGDEKALVAFAKRQWDIYKARNDSVIVDLFQGQYRSTLVCPECNKISIKFDPFMYLTLPIPNKKMWRGQVYFVPFSPDKPMQKFQVQLPAGATVSKLRQKVAAQFGVEQKKLICGEVWHSKIYKWIDDYEPLIDIKDGDFVYFWEVPLAPKLSKQRGYRYHRSVEDVEDALEIQEQDHAILPVFANYASDPAGSSSSTAFISRRSRQDAVGIPFFIAVPKTELNDIQAIRKHVVDGFSRFAGVPDELRKAVEDSEGTTSSASEQATPSQVSDWEMVDDANNSNDTVELVAPAPTGDDNTITEIREDGETVMVTDVNAEDSSDAAKPVTEIGAGANRHAVQHEPALRIRFSVAETGQGLPKGSESNADHLSEELGERHARLTKRSADAASAPVEVRMEDADEVSEADKSTEDASTAKAIPLVFTGGAIICTWSHSIAERGLLMPTDSGQLWGDYEEVIDEAIRARETVGSAKPKTLSIEDCMDEFTKEEQLGEDDPWYCPSCKEFRQATKKFDLWKAPDMLVVHLKRFSAGRHSRDKLNMLVDFPLEGLDLTDRVEGTQALRRVQEEAKESGEELSESMLGSGILRPLEDNDDAVAVDRPIYDLYAVDNHFGGLGGGHYTAFAKSPADGKWYEFDDSSVRPVANPESVKSASAYLLFYRRRTTRPIGGKSRQKFQEAAKGKAAVEEQGEAVPTEAVSETKGEYSSDSSSDDTPDWSLNMRSGAETDVAEAGSGWPSTGNSPASSDRAASPMSDRGLDSP